MMFSEDTNYFGPPSGSVDASVWKPHPPHDLNNHNSNDVPFTNKWGPPGTKGNKDFVYDDASAKAAWNTGGRPGSMMGGDKSMGGGGVNTWGPPIDLGNDMALDQELMQMNMNAKGPEQQFGGHQGGPGQWGRQEVNQAIPWDVDSRNEGMNRPPFAVPEGMQPPQPRGFMQQPMHFDNGNNQWRQWDNDGFGNKGAPDFNAPPFAGGPMPGQFNHGRINNFVPQQAGFNERMPFQMRNGPPFHHGGPHQPWMENKFNNGGHHQMHHPMGGPNAGGRFPFGHPGQQAPPGGPPNMMISGRPPLMPMQPPHHPAAMPPNFQIGSFQAAIQNDDAFWQDPNGELRKWQRDTGTAVWGDPAKQNSSDIRRWIQPPTDSDEENLVTADPLREGKEDLETGWGPPPAPPGQKTAGTPSHAPPAGNTGWNEPPRIPPQQAGFPPAPNSFHGGAAPPPSNNWSNSPAPGSADWTRPPGHQAPPMGGYNEFNRSGSQEEVSRIAEKLRLAVQKDLLDVNLLSTLNQQQGLSNSAQATATLNLLNTMLAKVSHQEALEAKAKKLMEYPNKKPEQDRIITEINDVKAELQGYRDQIHATLKGSTTQRGGILGDELVLEDQQDLAPTSLGSVGQLW